jgi:hypothetical protein
MALALPLLLLILSGLLDLGRVYFTYLTIQDAATESALYLSVNPFCPIAPEDGTNTAVERMNGTKDNDPVGSGNPPSPAACDDPNNAVFRAFESAPTQTIVLVDWDEVFMEYSVPPNPAIGVEVEVALEYPYEMLTPIFSNLVGAITLRSEASQIVISGAPPAGESSTP